MLMKDDHSQSMQEIEHLVNQLLTRFRGFNYASEEFWEVHDKLVKLLYQGIDLANEIGDSERKDEFREILDELKSSVPSGYWK